MSLDQRTLFQQGTPRSAGREAPAWQKGVGIVFLALPTQMALPAHHMFHTQYSRWMLKGFINSPSPDF